MFFYKREFEFLIFFKTALQILTYRFVWNFVWFFWQKKSNKFSIAINVFAKILNLAIFIFFQSKSNFSDTRYRW